jgi:ferredoxin
MATTITSECINCGACEPECPNTAIYAGGVQWELDGESHPAIAQDIYYIVPQKCTECVGFYDHEACAAVCPVDCCIPDPNNLEAEAVLIERARKLHPEQSFGADFPSRFRKGEAPVAAAPAAAGVEGAAQAVAGDGAVGAAVAAATAPAAAPAPKPAAPAAAPARTQMAPAAAPAVSTSSDEFDPITWQVPIRCKDCKEIYNVPFRHFQPGVVFYCPSCSGSFVPTSALYRGVKETFEGFYTRRRLERETFEQKRARELAEFQAKQSSEMEAFKARLQKIADEMKPAGKMVTPKGLASMFT